MKSKERRTNLRNLEREGKREEKCVEPNGQILENELFWI
jgi:hypothetical protein